MLRYLKLIFKYVMKKKTFFILALSAVIPSLIAGIALLPFAEMSVFNNPDTYENMSFLGIYWRMTGLGSFWFLKILALLLLCMMLTVLIATVDRHMRLGDLRFRNPLRRINESIWVVLPVFIAFVLFKEVFDILMSLLTYLCLPLEPALYYGVTGVGYVVIYFVFSLLISLFVMWTPHSFNTGLSAPKSLASSMRLAGGHVVSLGFTIFLGILPLALLSLAGIAAGGIATVLTSSICYFVLSIYFVVLMYVVYYDVTGIEREDINTVDFWEKKHV